MEEIGWAFLSLPEPQQIILSTMLFMEGDQWANERNEFLTSLRLSEHSLNSMWCDLHNAAIARGLWL
ncbi:MAG TPA: hypothetical protein DCE18_15680 [Syntrophobacteraceae bacterium]|nr:hypothetical protein [Syntrophobacteraceae bacterium]